MARCKYRTKFHNAVKTTIAPYVITTYSIAFATNKIMQTSVSCLIILTIAPPLYMNMTVYYQKPFTVHHSKSCELVASAFSDDSDRCAVGQTDRRRSDGIFGTSRLFDDSWRLARFAATWLLTVTRRLFLDVTVWSVRSAFLAQRLFIGHAVMAGSRSRSRHRQGSTDTGSNHQDRPNRYAGLFARRETWRLTRRTFHDVASMAV